RRPASTAPPTRAAPAGRPGEAIAASAIAWTTSPAATNHGRRDTRAAGARGVPARGGAAPRGAVRRVPPRHGRAATCPTRAQRTGVEPRRRSADGGERRPAVLESLLVLALVLALGALGAALAVA